MTGYIDLHCHLELIEKDIKTIVSNANSAKVTKIIANSVDRKTMQHVVCISQRFPSILPALGIYPPEKKSSYSVNELEKDIVFIRNHSKKIVAIGEVGLDYKNCEDPQLQKEVFARMINLSIELDKPLIVHSRNAESDVLDMLKDKNAKKVVLHCFSGKETLVKKANDLGYSFSIPTNVVKSKQLQHVINLTSLSRLFCETDSPFLSPFPPTRNEPSYVVESYKTIALQKSITLDEVKNNIFLNYQKLFC